MRVNLLFMYAEAKQKKNNIEVIVFFFFLLYFKHIDISGLYVWLGNGNEGLFYVCVYVVCYNIVYYYVMCFYCCC